MKYGRRFQRWPEPPRGWCECGPNHLLVYGAGRREQRARRGVGARREPVRFSSVSLERCGGALSSVWARRLQKKSRKRSRPGGGDGFRVRASQPVASQPVDLSDGPGGAAAAGGSGSALEPTAGGGGGAGSGGGQGSSRCVSGARDAERHGMLRCVPPRGRSACLHSRFLGVSLGGVSLAHGSRAIARRWAHPGRPAAFDDEGSTGPSSSRVE